MKKVTLLDTSICSSNIGDSIIMDAIKKEIFDIFPDGSYYSTLTHDILGKVSRKLIKNNCYNFVCGTNLLSSNMRTQKQWKLGIKDYFQLNNLILLGVGWKNYENNPTILTKFLLKKILSTKFIHSVRDTYTENKLLSLGIRNVINTGCPTMWRLSKEHCKEIPTYKSDKVILTLTDYRKSIELDKKLISILENNYKEIYFWPQGARDYQYAQDLNLFKKNKVTLINPNLQSFDSLLDDPKIKLDFIGTRLHSGIRALQKKHRTIIIGVDNRALEINKDTNLNVIDRNNLSLLESKINSNIITNIILKENNIKTWKKQFIN
ncbi:polysaccharide pyruvyl transferase family protein [Aliarcobacter butzleri]|uniref:polysaccharide pyruvyl transferase family protein n=1 Tax=Aliarcobacter butzleri TaxID=28197 RepID=UPI000F4A6A40|nr:polysaccharide pyruvyl transferase family protein [Aliarcobacter butzleri]